MLHISLQSLQQQLGVAPRLGGQHLNALCQQHRCLALHLDPMLQVLNHLDPVTEFRLERGQGLFA